MADQGENDVTETAWARSVYLYVMCAVSVALVLIGLSTAVVGIVHSIAPDLGHRDTLDRVGIGLSNIGGEIVDLFDESMLSGVENYCRDITFDDEEFEECVEDEQELSASSFGSIEEGIGEVRDELEGQIRNSSIDAVIRGILMVVGGVLLFRIHGRRTELFADGLIPRRSPAAPDASPPPAE